MGTIVTKDVLQKFITDYYGKTDISAIADGTATGAIKSLRENILDIYRNWTYGFNDSSSSRTFYFDFKMNVGGTNAYSL